MTVSVPTTDAGARMLGSVPHLLRKALALISLLDAAGSEVESLRDQIGDFFTQKNLNTATWYLAWWEEELALPAKPGLTAPERRDRIRGRIRSRRPPTMQNTREVANAYQNGLVEVIPNFEAYSVTYRFVSTFGRPANLDDLEAELMRFTEANQGIVFELRYLVWAEARDHPETWQSLFDANTTWDTLRVTRPEDLP